MSWGPWIDHDGSGCPPLRLGQKIWVLLADPEFGMDHYGEVIFTFGEKYEDEHVHSVEAGGSSWVLPVTEPDTLYVYRYRMWTEPGLETEITEELENV